MSFHIDTFFASDEDHDHNWGLKPILNYVQIGHFETEAEFCVDEKLQIPNEYESIGLTRSKT
jgi:hypothetical protein